MLNLDTHILIYALTEGLNRSENQLLAKNRWSISAIVLWEISKLAQMRRIEVDLDDPEVFRVLAKLHVWPIDLPICRQIRHLDFKGDPADELIAATSIVHHVPLLTRDRQLLKSRITPLA